MSDIANINTSAFASNLISDFYSCNTGTSGVNSFAQAWANLTGGNALAATGASSKVGRTLYTGIYPDERGFWARQWGRLPWGAKSEREIARAKYGFSTTGSKYYPDVVSGGSWKWFAPK